MSRLVLVVALLASAAGNPPRPQLRGPVDVVARQAAVGRPRPAPPALALPAPVRELMGVSYYVDAHHSVVDPVKKRRNEAAFAPVRAYLRGVVDLANGWITSRPAQPAYALRARDALLAWAGADALGGAANQQGEYERQWTLAGLALAYLQIRDAPGIDATSRLVIDRWLGRLAALVMPNYDRAGRTSSLNNHAYWAGLAVGATGAALRDRTLFDWGLRQARLGIGQVRADGFLPLELERGARALHYHLFALAPLVMLSELGAANGIDLYAENHGAIRRLADRTIDGLRDPAPFAAAAGAAQERKAPWSGADLAWAEPYDARFHDPRLAPLLKAARPLRDDRLGGDLTAAFGAPLP